ncbi:MAG: enoyl-CoA hydratase [Holophagales bacterium]|nr:enoyl-CoA hydratase [Holophagales bacterium]MYG29656.1 enoyl-CoA hydratase [Holophagales bacterium]MYI79826.1 enoyl-CoA hydratase [Holophagales bacterium]
MTTIDTGTNELLCGLEDGVATVTLNKPEKRNALGDILTPALRSILLTLEADERCGAILLTGAGRAFCAGGDVSGMGSNRGKNDEVRNAPATVDEAVATLIEKQESLTLRMAELGKPIVAALPGPAAGAGLSIALAADLRVMADDTFVTTAFRRVGLSGDYGSSWFLTRLVGPAVAKELLMIGRRIPAEECLQLGIVNRIVPFDDLAAEARRLALELANGPREAIGYMKRNVNRAVLGSLRESLAVEAEGMVRSVRTADHKEAVRAFMEKREPRFGQ